MRPIWVSGAFARPCGPPGPSPGVRSCPLGWPTRYADRHDRRTAIAASGKHPQRALRRGVALLHEVGLVDRVSLGARARATQGAWREQAAAADGPLDRV